MRTILLIIALLFASVICLPGGYKQVDVQEAENDDNLMSMLKAGREEYAQENNINSKLKLQKIDSVYTQVVNGLNARFNVELVDNDGSLAYVTLEVYRPPGANSVPALKAYHVNEGPQ